MLSTFWPNNYQNPGVGKSGNSLDFDSFFLAQKWIKCSPICILRPDLKFSHQNTSDRAIFKCLGKSFISDIIMRVNWNFFRAAPDGGWIKWKTTHAILFPVERGMIKSHRHHAPEKYLGWHSLMVSHLGELSVRSGTILPGPHTGPRRFCAAFDWVRTYLLGKFLNRVYL